MSVYKLKSDPPVPIDPYRPTPFVGTFKSVKSETGNIHIFYYLSGVQGSKLHSQPLRMMRLYSGTGSGFEELLQTLMPKRPDHQALV